MVGYSGEGDACAVTGWPVYDSGLYIQTDNAKISLLCIHMGSL